MQLPIGLSQLGRLIFLLKDTALYGGAAALSKAFALITFPLLARHFTVAEYGKLDYFLFLASLLGVFFVFGQDSAVARYFYEHEEIDDRRQLLSQSLAFQLAGLVLLLPLLWLNAGWVTSLLIDVPDRVLLFRIVLLQVPFLLLINFSQNLLKWTFSRVQFLTMSLGFTVVQASLLVLTVVVLEVRVPGVLMVSLATSSAFGVQGIFFVRKWLTLPKDFRRLREMLPFAMPFGIICVLSAFSPTLERTLTIQFLGGDNLGLYAAGTKIAVLLGLVINSFQTAWGPFSLALFRQPDVAYTYNWVLKIFSLVMCVSVLVITVIAQPLIRMMASERYVGAVVVVFPLALGLAIQALSCITEIGIALSKRSYLNLYVYPLSLVATLGGIVIFASVWGLVGVAMGVLLGQSIRALAASWLAQRVFPLPWQYAPVLCVVTLTCCIGFGTIWLGAVCGEMARLVALWIGIVAVLLVGWKAMCTKTDKHRLLELVRGRLARTGGGQ
ncbi:MAG: hypothetical protein BWK76_27425 [Desulfobulbaceae bacterium A2]|nr:MAG: hypothetical protein BWK76_27425 [Desulfobulbaceae bacterium A2]